MAKRSNNLESLVSDAAMEVLAVKGLMEMLEAMGKVQPEVHTPLLNKLEVALGLLTRAGNLLGNRCDEGSLV
jgi:hypothetical protein